MKGPSTTARRVAAYRLGFERLPAAYGRPADDDMLALDVAGPEFRQESWKGSEAMARLLRARTDFFDRVVTGALGRGVTQFVIVGAGYDGRALRYDTPGTRWWEVDLPETQVDKRDRLTRLGIASNNVSFVTHDLRLPGLGTALTTSGFEPDARSVMMIEGLAAYLDVDVLASIFDELRAVSTVGTRLAISLSRRRQGEPTVARRKFAEAVAKVGEPVRNNLDPEAAAPLFNATRWRYVELSERAQASGLVMVGPV